MRSLMLLVVTLTAAIPAWAAHRVTVEQLRQTLADPAQARKSDGKIAKEIAGLEMTERLTEPALNAMVAEIKPGAMTTAALALLADASAFLPPPASLIQEKAPPDETEIGNMLHAAGEFVDGTLRHLPDFFATRVTHSYFAVPIPDAPRAWPPLANLRQDGTFSQEVTYRDGQQVLDTTPAAAAVNGGDAGRAGFTSWGEFGPALAMILFDSISGKLTWSHWEQTASGVAAVFHYEVTAEASHNVINFCCVTYLAGARNSPENFYHGSPAYHGELVLDPATGAVVRITIEAELKRSDAITRADASVEYQAVEIGGESRICPVRSVVISSFKTRAIGAAAEETALRMNDVTFTNYHRFGSTSKILSGSEPQ
jgi:hypothetical protein